MNRPSSPAASAPVERRHRLAVLHAQGYSEEWLADRTTHYCHHWLEQGQPALGSNDKLAQAMADFEAAGRQDREAYARGLRQILDRVDRAIAEEVGQPIEPLTVVQIPWDLQGALERLERLELTGDLDQCVLEVIECFRKHQAKP